MSVITEPLRLAAGVEVTRASELPTSIRDQLSDDEQDSYAISRANARARSKIVSAAAGDLVQQFRQPMRLVDALLAITGPGEDVQTALDDSLPLVAGLLKDRVLLGPDDSEPGSELATLEPGHEILGTTLDEQIYAVDETAVWRGVRNGSTVALKLEVSDDGECPDRMATEIRCLQRTSSVPFTPTLLDHGNCSIGYGLALSWANGSYVNGAVSRLGGDGLETAVSVLEAYAALHKTGVLHGDVHPGNILVDDSAGRAGVTLIDFGLAEIDGTRSIRGGVSAYFDPEFARQELQLGPIADYSPASEQYAVATVLLEALLGHHPIDMPVELKDQLQAIVDHDPTAAGASVLQGDVADVFAKARANDPSQRFEDLDALAAALRSAAQSGRQQRRERPLASISTSLIDDLGVADPERMGLEPRTPRATVFYGAAGVALALLGHAQSHGDMDALSAARVWTERALCEPNERGFINDELTLDKETVNRQSFFHGQLGPLGARALVADAQADDETLHGCVRTILSHIDTTDGFDPMMGRPSILRLLTRLSRSNGLTEDMFDSLVVRAENLSQQITAELASHPPITSCRSTYLGAAHGWSGVLLSLLHAAKADVASLDRSVEDRVGQLALLANPTADGLWWPAYIDEAGEPTAPMDGWCNGSAGFVSTFLAAFEVLDNDERFLELATGAARSAVAQPSGIHNLCCGSAGKALALLDLARATGDSVWHEHAASLIDEGVWIRGSGRPGLREVAEFPLSLFKGDLGLALAADCLDGDGTGMGFDLIC